KIRNADPLVRNCDLAFYLNKIINDQPTSPADPIHIPDRSALLFPVGLYHFKTPLSITRATSIRGESFLGQIVEKAPTTRLEYSGMGQAISLDAGAVQLSSLYGPARNSNQFSVLVVNRFATRHKCGVRPRRQQAFPRAPQRARGKSRGAGLWRYPLMDR